MMKIIIIPETDNRGNGKIKFTLSDNNNKIHFEFVDKEESFGYYSLEFRIQEGNHISEEVRNEQRALLKKLINSFFRDKERIREKSISESTEKLEDYAYGILEYFMGSSPHFDIVLFSEKVRGEILQEYFPKSFVVLMEAFQNELIST